MSRRFKIRISRNTSVTHPDHVCLRYTHHPVVPPLPCGLLYQKLGHPLLSGTSNQTSCPQSSSDGMWASLYCTQSLFLWYNSAQSENHVKIAWANVQHKVHANHWMFKTNYKFTHQCCVLYAMHHTPQHRSDYGLLTMKGYLLIIMENVRNQQYQASGIVRAEEKTKSHYTVTAVHTN
jgi:hypothetical protein